MFIARQHVRFCASRDGTQIAFATGGTGPPLVRAAHWLSHLNLEVNCPLWGPWLSALARRHTLIRYDGRGSGLSDRDPKDFSLDRCVEDLEAVIESCKLGRFVLFGATIGGMTALAYAARHPERVTHLVIVGGRSLGRLASNPTAEQAEKMELELNAIKLGWTSETPAYRQLSTSLLIPDATPEQMRSLNDLMRVATTPEGAIKRLRPYLFVDLREMAKKVQCPTLVFHSRGDGRIPFEHGRALATLIPRARFVPLESRNHWVVNTEPAWQHFVSELDNFLPAIPRVPEGTPALHELTRRELQVLELIAEGIDNRAIGQHLGISEKTVRNHVSTVFSKLGCHTRAQAIVWARDAGLARKQASA
jgi:pimeloyl-ACP methyl ester carboxylesterase/DNA-binding CsgD family transcriptional regulator